MTSKELMCERLFCAYIRTGYPLFDARLKIEHSHKYEISRDRALELYNEVVGSIVKGEQDQLKAKIEKIRSFERIRLDDTNYLGA